MLLSHARLWQGMVLATCLATPAWADDAAVLERALDRAMATFESALPDLGNTEFGVDVRAYRDAISLRQFQSAYWGGTIRLDIETEDDDGGSCGRFAAYVRMPPQDGAIRLVLCPQFFSDGADALRELTLLHEMVHAVAGRDECQAMAFAARVEMAAKGSFTPVDAYWQASGCAGSGYSLP